MNISESKWKKKEEKAKSDEMKWVIEKFQGSNRTQENTMR